MPDDLKSRMDAAEVREPKPNWSALAQEAFSLECARAENRRKGAGKMNAMVDRLRKSKERADNEDQVRGHAAGRVWAQGKAEFDELLRLKAAYGEDTGAVDDFFPKHVLEVILGAGAESWDDVAKWWNDNADEESASTMFAVGFVEGAIEAFEEVEEQLG
ncbi:MAG: hypothetical protein AB7P08_18620 [Burkholderiales bacterium]